MRKLYKQGNLNLTAVFEPAEGGYVGYIEEIPGVNTQGDTLEETKENLMEALDLVLSSYRKIAEKRIKGKKVIRYRMPLSV